MHRPLQVSSRAVEIGIGPRASRVRITAIDGKPSWVDPSVACFFSEARADLGCSRVALAHALATTPEVIANLECGRLRALPPRRERERIVRGYGRLLGIDASGVLERMQRQSVGADPKSRLITARERVRRRAPRRRSRIGMAASLAVVAFVLLVVPASFIENEVRASAVDMITALMRHFEREAAARAAPSDAGSDGEASGPEGMKPGSELPSGPG